MSDSEPKTVSRQAGREDPASHPPDALQDGASTPAPSLRLLYGLLALAFLLAITFAALILRHSSR